MPVTPADDQRHAPDSAAPEWSESWSFYCIDPRRQLCCVARLGLSPNKGTCSVMVCMSREEPATVTIHVSDPLRRRYLLNGTRRTSMACYLDGYVVHSAYFDFVLDDGTRGLGAEEYGYRLGEVH